MWPIRSLRRFELVFFSVSIVLLASIISFFQQKPYSNEYVGGPKHLTIGTVSTSVGPRSRQYSFLSHYLNKIFIDKKLSFDLIVADNQGELISLFEKGKLDIYVDHAVNVAKMKQSVYFHTCQEQINLEPEKNKALLVALNSSDITTLDKLQGKGIVFNDLSDQLGYQIAKSEVLKALDFESKDLSVSRPLFREKIEADLTKRIEAMDIGHADVAAFSSKEWDRLKPGLRAKLKVIHSSKKILGPLLCYHRSMHSDLVLDISSALERMNEHLLGRQVLFSLDQSVQFERLDQKRDDLVKALQARLQLLEAYDEYRNFNHSKLAQTRS